MNKITQNTTFRYLLLAATLVGGTGCGSDLCWYGGLYYDDAVSGPTCQEFTRVNACIREALAGDLYRGFDAAVDAGWKIVFKSGELRTASGQLTNGHYDRTTIYIPDTDRWVYSFTHEMGHLAMFYSGQGADVAHANKQRWPLWDHELAKECK